MIPVVHDQASGQTHFFSNTPAWGGVYFPYFRSSIQELSSTTARNGEDESKRA